MGAVVSWWSRAGGFLGCRGGVLVSPSPAAPAALWPDPAARFILHCLASTLAVTVHWNDSPRF